MKKNIRNFCIIAHIDHGKSTLADRFLELTGTVSSREMRQQYLDSMDIERERGITIKLQPVRMNWQGYELNLIDTPGHVDFSYEVSRSLAAVEGAILLVDASQGVQAQTVANLYLAVEQGLEIIPVLNKIDLPNADVKRATEEICLLTDCKPEEVLAVSAKTGQGVLDVLSAVIERVPEPKQLRDKPLRTLIFDSSFDDYRGVITQVRVVDGELKPGDEVTFMSTGKSAVVQEVGFFSPKFKPANTLISGEIGYVVTGIKDIQNAKVGDTITHKNTVVERLPGYKDVKPMVFAGIFCKVGDDYPRLRDAIEKLKLNDSALVYEPENSQALGFGFRCGFLGMLHLEVVQERLTREYDLDLVVTVPSVAYQIDLTDGKQITIHSPHELPMQEKIVQVYEPMMTVDIFSPKEFLGQIMQLVAQKRGVYLNTEYLDENIGVLHYRIPLTALLVDFYDKLKSISKGYASLNYDFHQFEPTDIVKLDILVAEEKVEALSSLVYKDEAYALGKKIVETLKESLPRQMFVVKIQASVGSKVIAAERLSAMRKDVTAKLYGGDFSRKRKLLEKQKKGKKKMMEQGRVEIPPETYLKVLKK